MKTRTVILSLFLLAMTLMISPLTAFANDGDWTPDYNPQWWWKYVRPGDGSVRVVEVSAVKIELVRSAKVGYVAHQVSYTLINKSNTAYKGGNSFLMEHGYCDPSPQPWKPVAIGSGRLPALNPGQSTRLVGIAYTPEKGNYKNFAAMTIGQ